MGEIKNPDENNDQGIALQPGLPIGASLKKTLYTARRIMRLLNERQITKEEFMTAIPWIVITYFVEDKDQLLVFMNAVNELTKVIALIQKETLDLLLHTGE